MLGDFNARSKSWWKNDANTNKGARIDVVASSYGLYEFISQPIHLLVNFSSCVDLIFTDQPTLVVDFRIHSYLHLNSHCQVIYSKLELKFVNPPPYQRDV